MDIKPISYRFHGCWLALLLVCGSFSLTKVNSTIERWNSQREAVKAHKEEIEGIERKAGITQAQIDNHINIYDSVTLTDYTCNPDKPPSFDIAPFVKAEPVNVADKNQRVIGYIDPNGTFTFLPNNCTSEIIKNDAIDG